MIKNQVESTLFDSINVCQALLKAFYIVDSMLNCLTAYHVGLTCFRVSRFLRVHAQT